MSPGGVPSRPDVRGRPSRPAQAVVWCLLVAIKRLRDLSLGASQMVGSDEWAFDAHSDVAHSPVDVQRRRAHLCGLAASTGLGGSRPPM